MIETSLSVSAYINQWKRYVYAEFQSWAEPPQDGATAGAAAGAGAPAGAAAAAGAGVLHSSWTCTKFKICKHVWRGF